jgi:cytochrome P450
MSSMQSALVWGLRYGLPGAAIRLAARRGELIARSVVDPAAMDDPARLYAQLRALGPIAGNPRVRASAHHGVVNQILRHGGFVADPGAAPTRGLNRLLAAAIDPRALGPVDAPSLLAIQPPQHTRIRKLVTHAFTPRAVAGYADRIAAIANGLLDQVDPSTRAFDLVKDYAAPLPVAVIAEIFGIPTDIRSDLLRIGNEAAVTLDPALTWRDYRAADRAIREGNALLDRRIAEVRRDPGGDDLLSQLVRASADGDRLSDEELRGNALLLIGAGFETTVNLIGNAVALLLDHPEQLAGLLANPDGWDNAVDEVLRYDSPVQLTVRIAAEDVQISGERIRAGRPVILMLAAANRDPAVFDDPDTFNVARTSAHQHLAFSAGIHYCLGSQLARLEAKIALRTLFTRFPTLARHSRPTRRATRVLRGYESLPVTVLTELPVGGRKP